jgi:AAA+ superfamily predicted ATPase
MAFASAWWRNRSCPSPSGKKLPFESAPLHGLILLTGAPGTGKTTLARGLANQIAKQLPGTKATFVEIDPHALTSSALGRSQQAVAKLFEHTIPEFAMDGVAIVLLDEVETLAVSRHRLSLEANPIDVHRATDAALAGMDRLTREHRNVLLVATTNFPEALDTAVLSRADHIEEIGLPNAAARTDIIADTLKSVAGVWRSVQTLEAHAAGLAKAAEGLDGRRIRKGIFAAMGRRPASHLLPIRYEGGRGRRHGRRPDLEPDRGRLDDARAVRQRQHRVGHGFTG